MIIGKSVTKKSCNRSQRNWLARRSSIGQNWIVSFFRAHGYTFSKYFYDYSHIRKTHSSQSTKWQALSSGWEDTLIFSNRTFGQVQLSLNQSTYQNKLWYNAGSILDSKKHIIPRTNGSAMPVIVRTLTSIITLSQPFAPFLIPVQSKHNGRQEQQQTTTLQTHRCK